MATRIRLARGGAKKRPYYRIVVTDSRSPRDGRFIEKIGTYNPMLARDNANRVTLKTDRVAYWLENGAEPSERVLKFLVKAGVKLNKASEKLHAKMLKAEAVITERNKAKAAKEAAEKAAEEAANTEDAA